MATAQTPPPAEPSSRTGRVVLLGATGYTGRLAAEAMTRAGLAPVLAGRDPDRVAALAEELAPLAPAGAAPGTAVVDVADASAVRGLLGSADDVLVTTVGPFLRLGAAAVRAAVDAGAAYVDSTGEPPFVRQVFGEHDAAARRTGARLLTAFGYDYVPGNLAGALALAAAARAGRPARRVDVGYFVTGGFGMSGGTRASAAGVMLAEGFEFRRGLLRPARPGAGTRAFDIGGGRRRLGLAVAGSEHLALPRLDQDLDDVGVYLGWAGRATRPAAAASGALGALLRVPVAGGIARAVVDRVAGAVGGGGSSGGPGPAQRATTRTRVVAEAADAVGRPAARVVLDGPDPYGLTADLLAWGAAMLRDRAESGPGALGPADAFGLDRLVAGCADMGLVEVAG